MCIGIAKWQLHKWSEGRLVRDSHLVSLVAVDPNRYGGVVLVVGIFDALDKQAGEPLLRDGFALDPSAVSSKEL